MDMTRLAAKQKRYRDILSFTNSEVGDPQIKTRLISSLNEYKVLIAKCWQKQSVDANDTTKLNSLERALETLCGEARLRTATR